MTMRQSVMLSDWDVPGSESASTVALNQTEPLVSSAAPPSPLWRAAFALAAAEEASPVSAAVRQYLLRQSQGACLSKYHTNQSGRATTIRALINIIAHDAAAYDEYYTCT